ncbi:hypothetical protein [Vallitalea guaymasensis]|nr:hypothetical protein [Vallitalea guaymasensis]
MKEIIVLIVCILILLLICGTKNNHSRDITPIIDNSNLKDMLNRR